MRKTTPNPAPARKPMDPSAPGSTSVSGAAPVRAEHVTHGDAAEPTPAPSPATAYEVGRNKPPHHSRFKPGVSGNPGGRKKGSRNLKTVFSGVFESEITINDNGQSRSVTILEALVLRQVQDAMRGNSRAQENLLDRYERLCPGDAANEDDVAAEDQVVLRRARARLSAGTGLNPCNGPEPEPDDDAE